LLILSPHPDDLELSCGLLCHKATLLGWHLVETVLTDGAAGGNDPEFFYTEKLRQQRIAEACRGGSWLGVGSMIFWRYADSKLACESRPATKRLLKMLELWSPAIIVFPSSNDIHPDHASTHMVAVSALEKYRKEVVSLQYCFWGEDGTQNVILTHPPGVIAKEAAIKEHKSQPIDKYLCRLYKNKVVDEYEQYHSPDPDKTILTMSKWGFDVHRDRR
jgi:LmbE family N-acetylglucosaminyl deacetylase